MVRVAILSAVVVLALVPSAYAQLKPVSSSDFAVFVLAGQSNMAGMAAPDNLPANNRIWELGAGTPHIAVDPLQQAAGEGPGVPFARVLAGNGFHVGLVQCAINGSAMQAWVPGGSLYDRCLTMVRQAEPYGQIAGILYWQGETDAETLANATAWPARFTLFAGQFRSDLDDPALPLVYAQLASLGVQPWQPNDPWSQTFPYWDVVKDRQAALHLSHAVMVRTDDLPLKDGLHLDTAGVQAAGCRFALAWASLVARRLDGCATG